MKTKSLAVLLLLTPLAGWSQTMAEAQLDTILRLPEASITSNRVNYFSSGTTIEKMDKELLAMNRTGSLSELFSSHSNLQVNSYGPGGMSSISIRGGKTRNTAVLWNGLNLQSPMNGSINLSNIPSGFFNAVQIQKGHTVALFGSGATSGIIHLDNKIPTDDGASVKIFGHYGSFQNQSIGTSLAYRNNTYSSSIKVYLHDADNNFRYKKPYPNGYQIKTQEHAGFQQKGMLWDNNIQLKPNQIMAGGMWYQQSNKEIQPLISNSRPGTASQHDESWRGYMKYSFLGDEISLRLKQGILLDETLYTDPEGPEPRSFGHSLSLNSQLETKFTPFEGTNINAGLSNIYESGRGDMYLQEIERFRQAAFGSFALAFYQQKLQFAINARQEIVAGIGMPFTFSTGTNLHTPLKGLVVKGSVSRNNLVPTFNDLHWKETRYARGNPDLKNELSWNTEAGIEYKKEMQAAGKVNASVSFFNNRYKNLIIWLPDAQGVWWPDNKERVVSHGLESNAGMDYAYNQWSFSATACYTYTKATVLEDEDADYSNKPLVYTPGHKSSISLTTRYRKRIKLSLTHRYTSHRYFDSENTIPDYQLLDVMCGYTFQFGDHKLDTNLKVFNLTNEDYQVMNAYAMPLRNYQLQIIYHIQ